MSCNRREVLATSLVGAGGVAVSGWLPAAEESPPAADKRRRSTDPFQRVELGKTGLSVSLVGIGTGMRGGNRQSNQTRLGKQEFEKLLRYAFERGIRLFDCADMYGSHPYLAAALAGVPREQYVLCTKIWVRPGALPEPERPDADVVVDRFRKELGMDYLDLVLIHCMEDPHWLDQQKRQMEILARLKERGVVRAVGASIHSLDALKACAQSPWVQSVHSRINPYGDSMDHRDPAVVAGVLQQIHAAGKGVVGMKLVGEGRYRNDPQKRDHAIRYVLGLGCVDTMIVGFEKPAEIDDFAARVKTALEAAG